MNAQEQDFSDYYSILQIHQDADPEIVKCAYRKLAQLHHPDRNPDPQSILKMQLINQAYNTISNPELRRAYHSEWLRFQQEKASRLEGNRPDAEAQQVLDAYFRYLMEENWTSAYNTLTLEDRRVVTLKDFCDWKKAVAVLYQMGSYAIKPFCAYDRCMVGEKEYEKVHAFSVNLTDKDKRTGSVSEENYTKYVVWDRGYWRVCLGYKELKPIIYKLKYLASQAPEADPSRVYADTMLKYDKLTGLYSRKGLMECLDKEIARARRFKNSFCLAVIGMEPSGSVSGITDTDYMHMCLSNAAVQLKKTLRSIDIAARFSHSQLSVLLIETEYNDAWKALNRFIRAIKPGEGLKYTVSGSITPYQGETVEDTMIRATQDARMLLFVDENNVSKYKVRMTGQPV
jgi:diguanylate cyclase (GGDEF)-like protein